MMVGFINKLEKEYDIKIIRSSVFSHGINSFDLDENGNINHLYLFEVSIEKIEKLLPIASQLTDLSLEDCDIEHLDSIKYFSKLNKLDLCFNPITNATIKNLETLKKLKILKLDYTDINDTSPLGNLKNLEELHLHNCMEIEAVLGLEKLTNLKVINLNSTCIESLEDISVHNGIRSISLRDAAINHISGLDRFPNLEELVITGQSLSKIEGFEKSNSLKRLRLSTTSIEIIEGLEHLANLEILDLHHNRIKKTEGLECLMKLKKLNLSENEIKKVENLDQLTNLEYILLECCEIKEVDTSFLTNLSHPCFISLVGNPIKKLSGPIPDHVTIQFETDHWVPKSI